MAEETNGIPAAIRALQSADSSPPSENLLDPKDFPKDAKPKKKDKAERPKREIDNKTRPGRQTARTDLTEDIQTMLASFAMPLFAFSARNPKLAYDANVIIKAAPDIAEQLNELAQRNPAVHRVLFAMMNGTDAMALGMTLSQVVIPILANHEIIPKQTASMFGAEDPDEFLEKQKDSVKAA